MNKDSRTTNDQASSPAKTRPNDTSLSAQRQRIIAALTEHPKGLTTIQFREQYDCFAPAPRIFELRHDYGFNIQTVWTTDVNAQGNRHRVARYILLTGEWEIAA